MVIAAFPGCDHRHDMTNRPETLLPNEFSAQMRPEQIGYRLRLLREALGLGKAEMADLLGIERTYWSRFEGGKRAITDPMAALLVARFGVDMDFIILGRWEHVPFELAAKMQEVDRNLSNPNN